ncbi:unnamed protein product, partial [marine sediment metagenome]
EAFTSGFFEVARRKYDFLFSPGGGKRWIIK